MLAGVLLEKLALLEPSPRTALILALVWACALGCFALTYSYPVALVLLFIAGFFELSFSSIAQSLVQLNAPAAIRGRVIGLYGMSALGMRAFSGISVGVAGSLVGIHTSLATAAGIVLITITLLFIRFRTSTATIEQPAR
jgi:MFS family permease